MANLRDLNQSNSNPFWDWVADIEKQSRAASQNGGEGSSQRTTPEQNDEVSRADKEKLDETHPEWNENALPPPPPPFDDRPIPEFVDPIRSTPPAENAEPPQYSHHPGEDRGRHHQRGGHCGRGDGRNCRRGGQYGGPWGQGFGGWGGKPSMWGGGPFGRRRGEESRGARDGSWEDIFGQGGFDLHKLVQILKDNLGFDLTESTKPQQDDKGFTPAIDVFDTTQAYYVHLSLAGAKKQDLDVSWDAENFQIIVSGIIHRPGDEEFLKKIAVDERDIGLFERKIKLGTKVDPVSVDADGITAKMEDGVLIIYVPKHEEFVEIKKVDIE